jgi:tRNA(Ile)-lysidine synthase
VFSQITSNIVKKSLFNKNHTLLLAISGGLDSVVLAHLLKSAGFKVTLAHCNFQLRGKDSEADEKFCKKVAKTLGVPIYVQKFDTKAYCILHKTNVQLAARKLRYTWFMDLLQKYNFDRLVTAHHANDLLETVFINLLRGTGINGLKGIPEINGKIVRPLLNVSRSQLEKYARENAIAFRSDKSNFEDKYERNFIRLQIIPLLKKLNPQLEDTFLQNTAHFKQEAGIVAAYLEDKASELLIQTQETVFIDKKKLSQERFAESILNYILRGYGFNETQQKNILKNILTGGLPGKTFNSPTHLLLIDRKDLIIKLLSDRETEEILFHKLSDLKKQKGFHIKKIKRFEFPEKNDLIISEKKIIFPLTLRPAKKGDKFKPFGMKGFKLLSDFFKDEKLNQLEKEKCKVLVNGNGEIIWLIGHRSDERYRVNTTDTPLLKLSCAG